MSSKTMILLCLSAAAAVLIAGCDVALETGRRQRGENAGDKTMARATFAAGCFWGVEETFRQIEGVTETTAGYTGGFTENPTYEQVCSHTTGHAEAVQVEYDAEQVSYEELLSAFWNHHDPTSRNRQGPDVGSQYRSAIFCHTPEQKAAAEASKQQLDDSGRYERPVATQIEPAATFWPAEGYHQCYMAKQRERSRK